MKRLALIFVTVALAVLAIAPSAHAAFGIKDFDLTFTDEAGSSLTQAGSHPFAVNNLLEFNTTVSPLYTLGEVPDGAVKDLRVSLPAGLVGEPGAIPRCASADFINFHPEFKIPDCSDGSAVGVVSVKVLYRVDEPMQYLSAPVYNLVPPPGAVQKLGFIALGVPVAIEFTLSPTPPYNIEAKLTDTAQPLSIYGSELTVWGNPASPVHDSERGGCIYAKPTTTPGTHTTGETCPSNVAERPFITLPRTCDGPLATSYTADSWQNPGAFTPLASVLTHDDSVPPQPQGMTGCSKLGFNPSIAARPTTRAAQSPTGLDFSLDVNDEGLASPTGLAQADVEKAVVTLPEGFSANPSIAAGLGACSEADLARETPFSDPGAGCPNASKVGTVEVETPLLEESVNGALFIAKPYENPFGSLLALYMVIKNPSLGIVIRQPLEVEPDPTTGRITTIAEDLPQLPFSHFKLRFREGSRSPLVTPPGCGSYETNAVLTPSSGGAPVTTTSAFEIVTGPAAGPCPAGATPFHPGLEAGTTNNAAGQHSPFYLRLSRRDGEQEFTRFSIKLPPGVTGKLAGIPFCPDAAIAAAKARTGPNGGQEELDRPSCPAASEIGRTLVGAGVGPSLAYASGKVYLAGPYNGSSLSIAAITAAKVGPFDLGTVVVREALKVNPETAEVFIDPAGSDPIPHIIKGIPVHARDIRVYVNRPDFVLNPTSCRRTATASTVFGSGLDFGSGFDDVPATVTSPFQAADCSGLGFKPRLSLSLKGGTKRGAHPALRAVLRPRAGDANSRRISVALPHSQFLEQGHINTLCTRVQFNAGQGNGSECPAGAIYGRARAFSPILDEPLEGPIFLRSSDNPLPDLVLAMHGLIDFNAVGRIDSVNEGIRNTFDFVPDAPISKVVVSFQGGKKSLLVNSTNLCRARHYAVVKFHAHNGKALRGRTPLKAKCAKRPKGEGRSKRAG